MGWKMVGKQEMGPRLREKLERGEIWVDGNEYVEYDTDGVVVAVGSVGFESDCERFLKGREGR